MEVFYSLTFNLIPTISLPQNLYKYLTVNSGEPIQDVIKVSYVYDALRIERSFNFKLPVWATPEVLRQMGELHKISFELMGLTRRMQKLRTGVFLYDMAKKMEKTIKNPKDTELRKLNVYSTVSGLVIALIVLTIDQ